MGRLEVETLVRLLVVPTAVVVDIGPGIRPQTFFRPTKRHVCIEPFGEYADVLRAMAGRPDVSVIEDTALPALARMADDSADSVFMLDMIEHVERDQGEQIITEALRIARTQIVIFTPLGYLPTDYTDDRDLWGYSGAHWQEHRSGWAPHDFQGWDIVGSTDYHDHDNRGRPLDPAAGAFYAIWNAG